MTPTLLLERSQDQSPSLIQSLMAFCLLPAALGAALPFPWPPCPEPTAACLEQLEVRWLQEFGSLGLILERPELAQFRVTGIVPGGPADGLGIESGDLLIGIGDLELSEEGRQDQSELAQRFLERFLELRVGQPVRIKVRSSRSGIAQSFEIVPAQARPERARYFLSLALSKMELEHSGAQEWYHAYRDFLLQRDLPPGRELPDYRKGTRNEAEAKSKPPVFPSPPGSGPG